jgi:hypothetical protein
MFFFISYSLNTFAILDTAPAHLATITAIPLNRVHSAVIPFFIVFFTSRRHAFAFVNIKKKSALRHTAKMTFICQTELGKLLR